MGEPPFLPVHRCQVNPLRLPFIVAKVQEDLDGRSVRRIFPSPSVAVNPSVNAIAAVRNWNRLWWIEQNRRARIWVAVASVGEFADRAIPDILFATRSESCSRAS